MKVVRINGETFAIIWQTSRKAERINTFAKIQWPGMVLKAKWKINLLYSFILTYNSIFQDYKVMAKESVNLLRTNIYEINKKPVNKYTERVRNNKN